MKDPYFYFFIVVLFDLFICPGFPALPVCFGSAALYHGDHTTFLGESSVCRRAAGELNFMPFEKQIVAPENKTIAILSVHCCIRTVL